MPIFQFIAVTTRKIVAILATVLLFGVNATAQPGGYTDISQAPGGEYVMDKTHGYITFSYLHQGYSRPWLRFRDIDAKLNLDAKNPEKSTVSVSVDPVSIDSGVDEFDEHLRGDKFFDVARFTDIKFLSSGVKIDGSKVEITGDLTMKGITKSITLNGTFNKGGLHFKTKQPVLGFSATGLIKRSDWNLGYAVPIVGDEVSLVIEVEFNKI